MGDLLEALQNIFWMYYFFFLEVMLFHGSCYSMFLCSWHDAEQRGALEGIKPFIVVLGFEVSFVYIHERLSSSCCIDKRKRKRERREKRCLIYLLHKMNTCMYILQKQPYQ